MLRVKNWARFQHYKHRKPPWIRLYRELLDDMGWHALPVASRALAPMLWLLASETNDGTIKGDSKTLAFRLRIASKDFDEALNPLVSMGWVECSQDASATLAIRSQVATSESETEGERDSVAKATGAEAPSDPVKSVFDEGVALLVKTGTPSNRARGIVGQWRSKARDDERVAGLIREAVAQNISAPVPWFVKALEKPPENDPWRGVDI